MTLSETNVDRAVLFVDYSRIFRIVTGHLFVSVNVSELFVQTSSLLGIFFLAEEF